MPEDAINGRALATYSAIQTQTHSHAHCITEFTVAVHIFFITHKIWTSVTVNLTVEVRGRDAKTHKYKRTYSRVHIQQAAIELKEQL